MIRIRIDKARLLGETTELTGVEINITEPETKEEKTKDRIVNDVRVVTFGADGRNNLSEVIGTSLNRIFDNGVHLHTHSADLNDDGKPDVHTCRCNDIPIEDIKE